MMKKSYNVSLLPFTTHSTSSLNDENQDHGRPTHNFNNSIPTTKLSTDPEEMDFQAPCHERNGEDDIIFLRENKVPPNKYKKRAIDGSEINIIQNGGMLTDVSVNYAQMILHQQFPEVGGLEDTVLGPHLQFSVANREFVQVLHDGALHWVCISNIGCQEGTVNCFDSLNQSRFVRNHIMKQIACITHINGPELKVHLQPVQQQTDSVNCGPFSIAFATSILYGEDPASITYDVEKLRSHLLDCFKSGTLLPFPRSLNTSPRSEHRIVSEKLFCSCRMPWYRSDGNKPEKQMVHCGHCSEWYHQSCDVMPHKVLQQNSFWICSRCSSAIL